MSTFSTESILRAIRQRALTFSALGGSTVATLLGSRWYQVQPPDTVTYPYVTMTVLDRVKTGEYNGRREEWQVELQFVGRPRSALNALERIADVVDEAFLAWADPSSGLIFTRGERSRTQLPPFELPADREVCRVRSVFTFIIWPRFLTRYDVAS